MAAITSQLEKAGCIKPPPFLSSNIMYETRMGSEAYGVAQASSDNDLYGFVIPPKDIIFPHTIGKIYKFDEINEFNQFQTQNTIIWNAKEYDIAIYNIIHYFKLCEACNPNMIDSLFTPRNCVTHSTIISDLVRDNRTIFLHKGSYFKYRGYAHSQLSKIKSKKPEYGARKETVDKYGFDTKYCYHLCRLLNFSEQILTTRNIDPQQDREFWKCIRNGEIPLEDIENYFNTKEKILESLYHTSKIPDRPEHDKIKELLLNCLEHHYGSLDKIIERPDKYKNMIRRIKEIVNEETYTSGLSEGLSIR